MPRPILPIALALAAPLAAQQIASVRPLAEPAPTPIRTVRDAQDHLTFQIPANWSLATRDRELSTFHDEARSAPPTAKLRFVAAIPENPYPASTFSGAHFYLSVTPSQNPAQCAAQATPPAKEPPITLADQPVSHGHDEHGQICTQFRDEVYTLRRNRSCLRIDLAMNNFCGGEVSGVRDMTHAEIQDIRHQLETILQSIHFDR